MTVGGGSGGHVTPVVAVIRELQQLSPDSEIRFWCDYKFEVQARSLLSKFDDSIRVSAIRAGKLRRYNAFPLWQQLMRPSIVLPNIRDAFFVVMGVMQSLVMLIKWRPNVIFTKGGYVCLPVGIAAFVLRIPLVIHDSDAHPGLTNRILARWAKAIATGAPLKYYSYPADRSRFVGIPISADFRLYSNAERSSAKSNLGFNQMRPLTVVTGGGLGASRLNNAVIDSLESLLRVTSILLVSGADQYEELQPRITTFTDTTIFQMRPFISSGMPDVIGAADVVVSRAGATTIMELAAAGKPTILVPNAYLTGGHQLKNAKVYEDAEAVIVINEDLLENDRGELKRAVEGLLENRDSTKLMGERFSKFSKPNAAKAVASMILKAIEK